MVFYRKPIKDAPCKLACPAGIDVPRYIRAISERNFNEALAIIRESIPFPSICGRVCFRPCENHCRGNVIDGGPVAINALKRFVAERVGILLESPPKKTTGKSVAVIGSGPAGLTAAYYLARKGHAVTVFEALPEAGGMMRYGIPDYRLPKDLLEKGINFIRSVGVEIKTSARINSLDNLFNDGYHAVFVAIGAHKSLNPEIQGDAFSLNCILFLKNVNEGEKMKLGEKIVVIGGGNAAIDAARSVLRLRGKDVCVIYRRSHDEMLADPAEVENALIEGVYIQYLTTPVKISRIDGKLRVDCVRMRLGEVDESGRKRAIPIPGTDFNIEADTVISAVGQVPEIISGRFGLWTNQDGLITVAANNLASERPGIFAGGDCVSGPSSVIEAIAAGKKAAVSVDKHLGGSGNIFMSLVLSSSETLQTELQGIPVCDRVVMPTLPLEKRIGTFSPVEIGFDEELAVKEAGRCLRCDLPIVVDQEKCVGCFTCMLRCSLRHDYGYAFSPGASKVKVTPLLEGINEIIFDDECDTCGICARHCPYDAIYRGKKRPEPVVVKKR